MPRTKKTRAPIAAFTHGNGEAETVVVICNDGTGWIYDFDHYEWSKMAPIPGTVADESDK